VKVMGNWIVALTIVSLLAVGVVAVTGGGFRGNSAPCSTDKAEMGDCDRSSLIGFRPIRYDGFKLGHASERTLDDLFSCLGNRYGHF